MPRKKRTNVGGRPKEYSEKLRTISLSLPESLVDRLDQLASEAAVSRQRLIIEWLRMAVNLEAFGYLTSTAKGTVFAQFPIASKVVGFRAMTNKELAEFSASVAEKRPDEIVGGMKFIVERDETVETMDVLAAYGAAAEALLQKQKEEEQQ